MIDELAKLQQLHTDGTLTDAEFAQAKAKLLAPNAEHEALKRQLTSVERQQRVLQIDQAWNLEREQYFIHGKSGRYMPSKTRAFVFVVIGIMLSCLILCVISDAYWGSSRFIFAGAMFLMLLIPAINEFVKADKYERAEAEYYQRRSDVD